MEQEKRKIVTSQQKIILDYLKRVKTHPSAESIFKAVRKKLPRISLSTVYRNLEELARKGEIQEISGRVRRFDGCILPHAHFICLGCHRIFDVFQKFKILKRKKLKVGRVQNYQVYLYGYCNYCKRGH